MTFRYILMKYSERLSERLAYMQCILCTICVHLNSMHTFHQAFQVLADICLLL